VDKMEMLAAMEEWQRQRHQAGADPYDWTVFRGYMLEHFRRDPGVPPVAVFLAFEEEGKPGVTGQEAAAIGNAMAGLEKINSE
jgi:hypothetical protein